MSASAITELRAAFENAFTALGRDAASDRQTVVISWPSVPVELVHAASLRPAFARGSSASTPAADAVLEPDLFPNRLRQLVDAALTKRLANVAAIVLPRSSDADYKCFLYLRELARRGIASALPPVLLFDLLRSDQPDARAYNADRARDLSARLASLVGRPHRPDDLRDAIVRGNDARGAARRLAELRDARPRIKGADTVPLLGAFWQLAPERYTALAGAAADSLAARAPLEGTRVLVAGAPIDGTALHAGLEAEDAVVVAELSPFGGCGMYTDVELAGDPIAVLANHYARESIDARLPVRSLMRKLDAALRTVDAVVISLPSDDAAFGWDYPRVRELLARRSIPHTVLTGDSSVATTEVDHARIRALLERACGRREASGG